MMDDRIKEREEIELLLPWYEKGTLSADEMQRVERHMAEDPELRRQLELIREEVPETVHANESLPMPSSAARNRLMERIAAEAGPAQAGAGLSGWLSRLLPLQMPAAVALAGAAAALIILVQAVALVTVISSEPNGGPQLASGGEPTAGAQGSFVLVSFQDDASAAQIAGLLEEIEATIVDGPKPGNAFKLRLSGEQLPDKEREEILTTLRAKRDIVKLVVPAR